MHEPTESDRKFEELVCTIARIKTGDRPAIYAALLQAFDLGVASTKEPKDNGTAWRLRSIAVLSARLRDATDRVEREKAEGDLLRAVEEGIMFALMGGRAP